MAFGWKRKTQTFRERVEKFWGWYPTVADRYATMFDEGRAEELLPEFNKQMDKLLPGLSWGFGPGENGGHSFTITGEGQIIPQLLAEFWLSNAVEIPRWVFYGARQPVAAERLEDMAIRLGDEAEVDVNDFVLRTSVDEEAEKIDIVVWHPAYEHLDEELHLQILFLFLDEALGEFGTQTWIGNIEVEPVSTGGDTCSLRQLPEVIGVVRSEQQWEKHSPLETYSGYQLSEQTDGPRGDTVVGTTCVPHLIFEYIETGGFLEEDPLAGTGAELVYVAIDSAHFPDGRQVDVRGELEDQIDELLRAESSGRSLGGATGAQDSYIEFLLFDSGNGRRIIDETLKTMDLGKLSRLETFM